MASRPNGRISQEHAALRRVATLVGRSAPSEEILTGVAAEAGRLLGADFALLSRYDPDGSAEVIGTWARTGSVPLAEGTRLEADGLSVHALVFRTQQPARIDGHGDAPGQLAGLARRLGVNSVVGVPINLEGRLWGVVAVSSRSRSLPAGTETWLAGFTELVAAAIANTQARAVLRSYAEEQAALRRVATLVAQATSPAEVFATVAAEIGRVLAVDLTVMGRYERDGAATILGTWTATGASVPTPADGRVKLGGQNVTTRVFETGRTARLDSYADAFGAAADVGRLWGLRSMVGAPISVEGRLWGVVIVAYTHEKPLPADTEARLTGFTQLVATAIANTQARVELRSFGDEQAALRRVATLVARAAPPEEVFAAVTAEAGRLLEVDVTLLSRYDPDRVAAIVGAWGAARDASIPLGSRFTLGGRNVHTLVFETRRPARTDRADASGQATDVFHPVGIRSCVGAPINVAGQLWGVMCVAYTHDALLPAHTEARLAGFTELVATAIANTQARVELRSFGEEQAALRRVATLVAQAAQPDDVFAAVAAEAGRLLKVDFTVLSRYDPDGAVAVVGGWARADPGRPRAVGSRMEHGGRNVHTLVFQTGRPARIDDYREASGPAAEVARDWTFRTAVGAPITVEGRLWGVISVASAHEEPLHPDTEARLAGFSELVATAIANAEAEERLRKLADTQAALRRLAMLVAGGEPPEMVFAAVTREVLRHSGGGTARMIRYEPDGTATLIANEGTTGPHVRVGKRWESYPATGLTEAVRQTGRPARVEDYRDIPGGEPYLREGLRSAVGMPILVNGQLWGMIAVGSGQAPPPAGVEQRMMEFTDLVATAIANAQSRAEVISSRARIVAASDQARRRFERDLHDGAQQRLVTLGLKLRTAAAAPLVSEEIRSEFTEAADGLMGVIDELREISRGIHPAILSEAGLRSALGSLARRSAIPVELDVGVDDRLPDPVAVTAYYVVSEMLTNAAKHARASSVEVIADVVDGLLHIRVRDDGIGGADLAHGSGLVGLKDRVEATGGTFAVDSPRGRGTTVRCVLPVTAGAAPESPR
ncbi:MAG TPA: GAF domain-containing protein [Jatrophihabitans sp.]